MVKFNTEVDVTEVQVLSMMAAAGIEIGSMVTSKVGDGEVVGFEVSEVNNEISVLVCFMVGEAEKKVVARMVAPLGAPSSIPASYVPATKAAAPVTQEEDTEEADSLSAEINRLAGQAKSEVDATIQVGDKALAVSHKLTEDEQAFEANESERRQRTQVWKDEQNQEAKKASRSDAARKILEQAEQLKGGGAAKAPASKPAANGRANRPAAKSETATQNQTKNNGGNVQMKNQTQTRGTQQDRPAQGVAGGARRQAPAANTQTPATRSQAQAPTGRRGQAPATGGRARLGAGAPVQNNGGAATRRGGAATNQRAGVRLKVDAPVVNEYFGGSWFMNETRYPLAINGAEVFATRQNLDLGMTNINIYDTAELLESRGRTALENDFFTIIVHFGPALQFEFSIKLSSNPDAKTPFYCSNVSLIKLRNGSQRWVYITNRRKDGISLVDDAKKGLRAATPAELNNDKLELLEIANTGWTQEQIYGMNMSEDIIAQVMRLAQYAYDFENGNIVIEAE